MRVLVIRQARMLAKELERRMVCVSVQLKHWGSEQEQPRGQGQALERARAQVQAQQVSRPVAWLYCRQVSARVRS